MKANLDHRDHQRTGHSSPRIINTDNNISGDPLAGRCVEVQLEGDEFPIHVMHAPAEQEESYCLSPEIVQRTATVCYADRIDKVTNNNSCHKQATPQQGGQGSDTYTPQDNISGDPLAGRCVEVQLEGDEFPIHVMHAPAEMIDAPQVYYERDSSIDQ
eukprot:Tbor_TRINITY_DN5101_c1_g2::TRINITY_DN5101_c1_g2_i1::g.25989::m.25989